MKTIILWLVLFLVLVVLGRCVYKVMSGINKIRVLKEEIRELKDANKELKERIEDSR
jgi:FtsZ-binding cell division protein ZapB